jgi:hypothetical protein
MYTPSTVSAAEERGSTEARKRALDNILLKPIELGETLAQMVDHKVEQKRRAREGKQKKRSRRGDIRLGEGSKLSGETRTIRVPLTPVLPSYLIVTNQLRITQPSATDAETTSAGRL